MIRVNPPREVTLTPAPGWTEAAGRPVQRGEDDGEIADAEVDFRGRRRNPDKEREEPDEEPREEILAEEAYDSDEERRRLMRGRYAMEVEVPGCETEEEHASRTMGYVEYLKWRISTIDKRGRNKDVPEIERFKAL